MPTSSSKLNMTAPFARAEEDLVVARALGSLLVLDSSSRGEFVFSSESFDSRSSAVVAARALGVLLLPLALRFLLLMPAGSVVVLFRTTANAAVVVVVVVVIIIVIIVGVVKAIGFRSLRQYTLYSFLCMRACVARARVCTRISESFVKITEGGTRLFLENPVDEKKRQMAEEFQKRERVELNSILNTRVREVESCKQQK